MYYFRLLSTTYSCIVVSCILLNIYIPVPENVNTRADNGLLYLHKVYDELMTEDGSSLSPECVGKYTAEWESQVATMMDTVNRALDEGLCEEYAASVIMYTGAFASIGSQVGRCFSLCTLDH